MQRWLGGVAMAVLAAMASAAPPGPAGGTISIEAAGNDTALPIFAGAAGTALAARGFTLLEGAGHAGLVADLLLSRSEVGTTSTKVAPSRSSASPGGSAGVGASVLLALPTTKMRTVPLRQTRLEIKIHKRGESEVLWHGIAITVRAAETKTGRDEAVAADLAEALLRAYPAQPEDIVSVP
jgi:hypothetical protein